MGSGAPDRFLLSALADRLVFGDPETFNPEDAEELARLLPYEQRWHSFLTSWLPRFAGSVKVGGSSSAGVAAGVGHVTIKDDGKSFDYDSRGRRVLRAGQWKLHRRAFAIEIEQVMSDDTDEGRSAVLEFYPQQPMRMLLIAQATISIGPLHLGVATFRPWKVPK